MYVGEKLIKQYKSEVKYDVQILWEKRMVHIQSFAKDTGGGLAQINFRY